MLAGFGRAAVHEPARALDRIELYAAFDDGDDNAGKFFRFTSNCVPTARIVLLPLVTTKGRLASCATSKSACPATSSICRRCGERVNVELRAGVQLDGRAVFERDRSLFADAGDVRGRAVEVEPGATADERDHDGRRPAQTARHACDDQAHQGRGAATRSDLVRLPLIGTTFGDGSGRNIDVDVAADTRRIRPQSGNLEIGADVTGEVRNQSAKAARLSAEGSGSRIMTEPFRGLIDDLRGDRFAIFSDIPYPPLPDPGSLRQWASACARYFLTMFAEMPSSDPISL